MNLCACFVLVWVLFAYFHLFLITKLGFFSDHAKWYASFNMHWLFKIGTFEGQNRHFRLAKRPILECAIKLIDNQYITFALQSLALGRVHIIIIAFN